MKTGYHYTSYENWLKIKRSGYLKRSNVYKTEILKALKKDNINGIFLSKKLPCNKNHIGNILLQAVLRPTNKVVLLKVKYRDDRLSVDGKVCSVVDLIDIGRWKVLNKEAILILKDIPLKDIELVKTYNLMSLLK
jgi:hypothetical protein